YGRVRLVGDDGATIAYDDALHRVLTGQQVHGLAHVGELVFDTRLMPLYGPVSEILGTIGVATDVTERVRAERALRAHEERLAATLDSIAEAVVASDDSGCVRHMNPNAERLTGWTSREAVGRPVSEVVHLTGTSPSETIPDLAALAPPSSARVPTSRATTLPQ